MSYEYGPLRPPPPARTQTHSLDRAHTHARTHTHGVRSRARANTHTHTRARTHTHKHTHTFFGGSKPFLAVVEVVVVVVVVVAAVMCVYVRARSWGPYFLKGGHVITCDVIPVVFLGLINRYVTPSYRYRSVSCIMCHVSCGPFSVSVLAPRAGHCMVHSHVRPRYLSRDPFYTNQCGV